MRYTPVAVTISLLALVSASTGRTAAPESLDPRAGVLEAQGRAALDSGAAQTATDNFEAALAIDPGSTVLMLDLAAAARRNDLQGKALHYYRVALTRDPHNLTAIAGEGEALAEKGAIEKARRNLAELQNLCGVGCTQANDLAAAIARGPQAPVLTADATKLPAKISAN